MVSVFVYGSNPNVPDLVVRNNATYRLLTDQVGSMLRAINVSNANDVAFAAEYTAFGEQTVTTGSADFVPFGFAGGLYDAQTGLVRFGARDYDPVVGRWTAKDPIRFDGGQANLYAYVGNDPVNRLDSVGLLSACAKDLSGAAIACTKCVLSKDPYACAACAIAISAANSDCIPDSPKPPPSPGQCGGAEGSSGDGPSGSGGSSGTIASTDGTGGY